MSKDKEILERVKDYLKIIDENIKRCQEQQSRSSDALRDMYFCGEKVGNEDARYFLEQILEEFDCDNC